MFRPDFLGKKPLNGICFGKQKPTMSPLQKQGFRAKKLDFPLSRE